jgi:hypothetical protein
MTEACVEKRELLATDGAESTEWLHAAARHSSIGIVDRGKKETQTIRANLLGRFP